MHFIKLLTFSGVAGLRPHRNVTSYSMSKASLDQYTKCLALDLAPKKIRVNSVNPAAIRTPIFDTLGLKAEQAEKMVEEFKNKYPVGRIGDVSDTSAAIAYLADDKLASFLTGILLPVDGGSLVAGC